MTNDPRNDANEFDAAKPQVTARLLRFLGGFKLTLSLFACLGLFAAIGSIIPQGDDTPRIAELWGQDVMHSLVSLGLNEVYRSWWFVLVLALMALNLIMVTWVRVPHVWRISRSTDAVLLKDPLVPKTAFYRQWDTALSPSEAMDRARKVLLKEFPHPVQQDGPQRQVLVGERHFISLWSAHIVHLGLLLLLLAGVMKVLFGATEFIVIKEGDAAEIPAKGLQWGLFLEGVHLPGLQGEMKLPFIYKRVEGKAPFKLQLDRFEVRYYKDSAAPSLFRSDLRILKDGAVERVASVKVNDPLDQDGYTLYQSSYGYEGLYSAHVEVNLPGNKEALDVRAPYQQKLKLLDTGWELEVTDFYPDAEMAGPGKLMNKSGELHNPAIRVRFWQGGKERAHTWFVYSAPDIQMSKVPGLKLTGKTVDPIAYTVLQANKDPGVPVALAGALLVLLGVFTAFYLFFRKAWVAVEPLPGGGTRVTLAGFVRRNKLAFQRVFDRLSTGMDESLNPTKKDV